jgi:intraflagellar transport protein 52
LTFETLSEANLIIFAGPQEMFSLSEFDALKMYVSSGGSVLVLLPEGGETKSDTNLNYFLEEYGISVNTDSVCRASYYKYFHPKENLVTGGVVSADLAKAATSETNGNASRKLNNDENEQDANSLSFVYPFGATLNV